MIKRILPITLTGIAVCSMMACNTKKTQDFAMKNGVEYKIVKDVPGTNNPKVGDIVYANIRMFVDDSLIIDSREAKNGSTGEPVMLQVPDSMQKGNFESCFTVMTPGDSALFRVAVDSIKKYLNGQQLPGFMTKAKYLNYQVTLVSVKTSEEFKKDMEQKATQQKDVDDKLLQDYFAKNNIKATKTASGLYYVMHKDGSGESPKAGQTVSVNYTGTLLNGDKFDSNMDHDGGKPASFVLGQVIQGWNEGLTLMKKGGKATFYIPSGLAYGPQSPNPSKIPANAVMIFEVELLDFK